MKAKVIKLVDLTDDQLRSELGVVNAMLNGKTIEWTNAQEEPRTCPFNVFSHTGRVDVTREVDPVAWDAGMAVLNRCEAERRNGGNMISFRAGHQVKAGTCSGTVRTSGMKASESTVTVQLAEAQKLANKARVIGVILFDRAEAEKNRLAIEAEAAKAAKVGSLVKAAFDGGKITDEEAELLNAELNGAVA